MDDEDMAWVRFSADFDYQPSELKGRSTIAYKAGMEQSVRRECATQAVAAGVAEEIPTPIQATPAAPLQEEPAHGADASISG